MRNCYGMWLILRVKGASAKVKRQPLWYGTIYLEYKGIFCNLVITSVIINTLICNLISVIVKNSNHRSRGCRHTAEPHKTLCVFFLFFFFDSYHYCCMIHNSNLLQYYIFLNIKRNVKPY